MFRLTWRGLVAHRIRLIATVVAVMLGVGFVAGTYILTDTLRAAIGSDLGQAQGRIALQVDARSANATAATSNLTLANDHGLTIPASTVGLVASMPGVQTAAGTVFGPAKVSGPRGESMSTSAEVQLVSSIPKDTVLSPFSVRKGHRPEGPTQAVLDEATANRSHITIGQHIRVAGSGPVRTFRIVGLIGYGTTDGPAGATIVGITLTAAQSVLGQAGRVGTVVVEADPSVSQSVLREEIAHRLGHRFTVQTEQQVTAAVLSGIDKGFNLFNDILLIFAGVALFVAVFLIFNTFSILLTQRSRELALLRCLGALRFQLIRAVIAESVVIGALSSVLGIGLGVLLALGLRGLLAVAGIEFPSQSPVLEFRTVLIAMVVGIVATVGAALIPAIRGSKAPPVSAMREEPAVDGGRLSPIRLVTGVVLVTVGMLIVIGVLHSNGGRSANASVRADLAGAGLVFAFLGLSALIPAIARPVAGILGWPAARFRGVPGRLARGNAMRHPRRTAATAAALMIGLTLVSAIAVLSRSVQTSTDGVFDQHLHADIIISPNGGTQVSVAVQHRLADEPSLRDVAAQSGHQVQILEPVPGSPRDAASTVQGTAADIAAYAADVSIPVVSGTLAQVNTQSVAVTTGIAATWHLRVGSLLPFGSADVGSESFRVAAIIGDPTGLTGDVLFDDSGFSRLFPHQELAIHRIFIRDASPGDPAVAWSAVQSILRTYPELTAQTKAEFVNSQNQQFEQLIGVVTALLGLAVVIAFFGIVNTLALSMVERRREIGLVRALGLSRAQLRATVRWESVVVSVLGAGLGVLLGLGFGWVIVDAIRSDGVSTFSVPGTELVGFVLAAGIAGVVAAAIPARSASRVDVLAAITVE